MTRNEFTEALTNSDPSDWVKLSDIDEEYLSDITGIFKASGEDIDLVFMTTTSPTISKRFGTVDFFGDRVYIQAHDLDTIYVYMPKKNMLALAKPGDIVYNVEARNGTVYGQMMVAKDSLIGVDQNGEPITLPKSEVKSIRSR